MKFENFWKTYKHAHKNRMGWYHLKWRAFAILLTAALVTILYNFLIWRYPDYLIEHGFTLGERFFYWFMAGFIAGAIALAGIFEGEFILGVRKVAKEIHEEAEEEFSEERRKPAGRRRKR